jgi:hypothetical protein
MTNAHLAWFKCGINLVDRDLTAFIQPEGARLQHVVDRACAHTQHLSGLLVVDLAWARMSFGVKVNSASRDSQYVAFRYRGPAPVLNTASRHLRSIENHRSFELALHVASLPKG